MATLSAGQPGLSNTPSSISVRTKPLNGGVRKSYKQWVMMAGVVLISSLALAQSAPQVTSVDPATGKVNDTVTLSGNSLGKASVSAVYLSDDKSDFKAAIVDQSDDKISVKVPQVKAGDYNISIQVGDKLFIKPVKFKVAE